MKNKRQRIKLVSDVTCAICLEVLPAGMTAYYSYSTGLYTHYGKCKGVQRAEDKAKDLPEPSDKPSGMWKCAACGEVQSGSTLYRDPLSTGVRWTCSDLTCGGTCYSTENKVSL